MSSINQTYNTSSSMPEFRYLRSHFNSIGVFKNNFKEFLRAWLITIIFLGIGYLAIMLIMATVDYFINGSDYSVLNLASVRYKTETSKWYMLSYDVIFALLVFPVILNLHKLVLIKISGRDSQGYSIRSFIFLPLSRRLKIAIIMLFITLLVTGLIFAVSYYFVYYDYTVLTQAKLITLYVITTIFGCLYLELLFLLNYFFVDHEGNEFTAFKQMLKFVCSFKNIARIILLLINLMILWAILGMLLGVIMSPFAYAWYYITGLQPLWAWMLVTASSGSLVFLLCSVIFIIPYIYLGSFYERFCVAKY